MTDDYDISDLSKHVWIPVVTFLADFDIYVEHIGDLETLLKYIPKDMWPIIDGVAYRYSREFIKEHGLQQYSKLPSLGKIRGHQLVEVLAFLLKIAFQRGYFMYKFKNLDLIPPPNDSVDHKAILAQMLSMGSPDRPDMSTNIDVFLQRAVSLCTKPEQVNGSLGILGDSMVSIMTPHLEDWAAVLGTIYYYGILSAKAESELEEERLSKIEVKVERGARIGNIIISSTVQNSFNRIHHNIDSLKGSGQSDVAEALRHVTAAVVASDDLDENQTNELLERLEEISRQATLRPKKRSRFIKDILNGIAIGMGAAGGLATVWSTWGPAISRFFGLG